MIAHLSGKLLSKQPNQVIVDVHGVGYEVQVPLSTFYEIGEIGGPVELRIYTHVREDTIALFGFQSPKEKLMFEQVTSISGIGPKLGITILSGMPVDELVTAIRQSNLARLTLIPGVGKKTAERLVVELRDKLAKLGTEAASEQAAVRSSSQQEEDVVSALVNLGYAKPSAEKAVRAAASASSAELPFEELLRGALRQLSR
ncbi:MAG: Holliday junction branch migration protein RuvA [Acidimicrobiia bacterium]|nr:Holliday junction branch migration protein RuvA [Acidimicrobiia bacterium]